MIDPKEYLRNCVEVISLSHFVAFFEWNPPSNEMGKLTANWMINELFGHLKSRNLSIETCPVTPLQLREFLWFIYHDLITGPVGKKVLNEMFESGKWASQIILEQNLWNEADDSAIEKVIDEVIAKNAKMAAEYRSGKVKLFGSFVGQTMKALQGKADPIVINTLLKKKLDV